MYSVFSRREIAVNMLAVRAGSPPSAIEMLLRFHRLDRLDQLHEFRVQYSPDPHYPDDPISVTREEFDAACDRLVSQGVPLKADQDQAWRDSAGWRVNYDTVLLALFTLTMAPKAPWSSDRAPAFVSSSRGASDCD